MPLIIPFIDAGIILSVLAGVAHQLPVTCAELAQKMRIS